MSRVKQVTFTWLILSMRCSFLFLRIKKRDRQRFYAHMSYASHMYLVSTPLDSGNVLFSCHIFQTSDNGCYSCVDSCIHTNRLDILKEINQLQTIMEAIFRGGGVNYYFFLHFLQIKKICRNTMTDESSKAKANKCK